MARTQQTDLSVPSRRGALVVLLAHHRGQPVHGRAAAAPPRDRSRTPRAGRPRRSSPASPAPGEEVLVDGNAEAEGHAFFSLGALVGEPRRPPARLLGRPAGRRAVHVAGQGPAHRRGARRTRCRACSTAPPGAATPAALYYTVVDDAWRPYEVRRHVLGTAAGDDAVVHTEPDERFWVGVETTTSDRFLLVGSASRTTSEVRALDLHDPAAEPVLVAARRDGVEYDVDHVVVGGRDRFVVTHNDGAQDFAVALADVGDDDPAHWEELVPHEPGRRVVGAVGLDRAVVLQVRRDALTRVVVLPIEDGAVGEPWEVPLRRDAVHQRDRQRRPTPPRRSCASGTPRSSRRRRSTTSTSPAESCCCASGPRCSAGSTAPTTSSTASGPRRPTAPRCRCRWCAAAARRATAPRRCCCTATARTSTASTRRSPSRGCRCSTAAWCSPSPTSAAAASWAGPGTTTGR